jgi:Fe-S cluster assembly scaffold protein SufB
MKRLQIGDEQLFYLQSRGIAIASSSGIIVNGFIEPFTKELRWSTLSS